MAAKIIKVSAGVLVVAVCVAGLVVQYRENLQLRKQLKEVETRNGEVAQKPAIPSVPSPKVPSTIAEASVLRAELEVERKRAEDAETALRKSAGKAAEGQPAFALATGLRPLASLVNAGKTTAKAAMESRIWAHAGGDTDLVVETMVLPPETKKLADDLYGQLSPAARAQFSSPEQLLAAIVSGISGPGMAGVQVLSEQSGARVADMAPELKDDPSYRTLHVQTQDTLGVVRENDWVFQQTADGWRQVIQPNTVIKAGRAFVNAKNRPPQ